jgi:glutamyl-tRNA synthetase
MSLSDKKAVRVRFAPAPTGYLHIGNFRTAVFNWLFARHNHGAFLIRVEDTDTERYQQEYVDAITTSLEWSGFTSDDPIVIQSQRFKEHEKVVAQLLEKGAAYRCYCTEEEVIARHKKRFGEDNLFIKYDSYCRDRSEHDTSRSFVIRFALPQHQDTVSFQDMIRGTVTFDMDQFDDFIIVRSDGRPIYNLVVVLDDAFMKISHVIRGEDHIPNTPKQLFLFQACGYTPPQYAHLPLILGPSGDKLSKRDGAVSVVEYKDNGYLPDALINYLVRLGWSHGDQEIFTREELIRYFSLDHVGKSGSIFDAEKLKWVNSVYIKKYSAQELLDYITNYCEPDFIDRLSAWNEAQVLFLIGLYKERVHTVRELIDTLIQLHSAPKQYDAHDCAQWIDGNTSAHLRDLVQTLENSSDFSLESLSIALKQWCKDREIKLVTIAQPVRIALVGKAASPGVFELLSVLGKQETLSRIQLLLDHIDMK